MLADLVDLDNVRVLQAGDRLRLSLEAVSVVRPGVGGRQDHLQRHHAVEPQVPRLVRRQYSSRLPAGATVVLLPVMIETFS